MDKSDNRLNEILAVAEKERYMYKHPYVGSEHLFLAILKEKDELCKYLNKYGINYNSFKNELLKVVGKCKKNNEANLYTPLLRKIIKRFKSKSENLRPDKYTSYLFTSILDEGEGIAVRILLKMNIDLDEIYSCLKEKQRINNMEVSNKVGILLNENINLDEKIIGRDEEINKIILTLIRKKKCNPILIGPAGVGKTAIVEELTRRIIKGNVPEKLKEYKIIELEMGSLISGTKYRGEFEERLNKIIKEVINDKKTILFIDEIHSMINAGGADGAINASDILKPYLSRGQIKCIGATTTTEYNNSILKDKALERRFNVINIKEPSTKEMYTLINKIKGEYEKFHNIRISKKICNEIVDLSECYMKGISNPDKCIDLLDSSCAYSKLKLNNKELKKEDIIETIYNKTGNIFIKNNEEFNILKSKINNMFNNNVSKKIINTLKNSNHQSSFITDNDILEQTIKNSVNNINVIEIDLNKLEMLNKYSLSDYDDINKSVFQTLQDHPFSLILIKNINNNKSFQNDIETINKTGILKIKNNSEIYFNNSIIICYLNKDKKYQTGFSKSLYKCNLSNEFINSFDVNLINELKNEILQ